MLAVVDAQVLSSVVLLHYGYVVPGIFLFVVEFYQRSEVPERYAAQRLVQSRFYHRGFPAMQLHRVANRNGHRTLESSFLQALLSGTICFSVLLSARRLRHQEREDVLVARLVPAVLYGLHQLQLVAALALLLPLEVSLPLHVEGLVDDGLSEGILHVLAVVFLRVPQVELLFRNDCTLPRDQPLPSQMPPYRRAAEEAFEVRVFQAVVRAQIAVVVLIRHIN